MVSVPSSRDRKRPRGAFPALIFTFFCWLIMVNPIFVEKKTGGKSIFTFFLLQVFCSGSGVDGFLEGFDGEIGVLSTYEGSWRLVWNVFLPLQHNAQKAWTVTGAVTCLFDYPVTWGLY